MKGPLGLIRRAGVLGTFLAGVLALLPIVLTIVIVNWLVAQIRNLLGPGSFLGDLLTSGGIAIVGEDDALVAFWLGLVIALVVIWAVGLVVTMQTRRTLTSAIDGAFNRVPLLATIYKPIAQVVRLLDTKSDGELRGMRPVMVQLGGKDTAGTLALLASPKEFSVEGSPRRLIYMPTAPFPTGGVLLFIPSDDVALVDGMNVDELMRIYFSVGTLTPDVIATRPIARPTDQDVPNP